MSAKRDAMHTGDGMLGATRAGERKTWSRPRVILSQMSQAGIVNATSTAIPTDYKNPAGTTEFGS
jgi:hypothetical protein